MILLSLEPEDKTEEFHDKEQTLYLWPFIVLMTCYVSASHNSIFKYKTLDFYK